ncbi:unnamed protein product [[Candida] boidinii]|nr:unnamed protein product [[Candida] boidinii]
MEWRSSRASFVPLISADSVQFVRSAMLCLAQAGETKTATEVAGDWPKTGRSMQNSERTALALGRQDENFAVLDYPNASKLIQFYPFQ